MECDLLSVKADICSVILKRPDLVLVVCYLFSFFFLGGGWGGTYRGFVDPYPLALTVLKLRQ